MLKNTIDQIFDDNTNYVHAQQVLNQANSLKALSSDLYTDPLRFVYELVQNCDDSCQSTSILRIAIVEHRYLIICHNGKAFDEDDIRSLCDVGCSTKRRDEQKTGYKGLGFKAVFGQSDYILIISNGEYFRFDAKSNVFKTKWNRKWGPSQADWEEQHNKKFEFPWQICPIWTEKHEVPKSIRDWLLGQIDAVGTIVRLQSSIEAMNAIKELTDQPHVFMFLRNIRTIRFSFNSPNETILAINQLHDGSIRIIYDWKPMSHWLLHRCNILVSKNARDDSRLPEKLRTVETIEVILAVKIDKNDNIENLQGRHNPLFAYLPTRITTYNLPIAVNAQFFINASREHIHTDSSWNQFIFSRIPHEIINWIGKLSKQDKWKEKALDLLPRPIPGQDALSKQYNESCSTAEFDSPFLSNEYKQLLRINEAVIHVTGFSRIDCLGDSLMRDHIFLTFTPTTRIAEHPFIANNKRLRRYKILIFEWNHCLDMLNSTEFLMKFTPEQDIRFIIYLFNHQNLTQIQTRLHQLPFLMDHTGLLRTTNHIYIPSHFNNNDWLTTNDADPYLHENIMLWLTTQLPILNWLKSLGVTEKTDEMFIRRKILPNVRSYATRHNTIPTIRKLFDNFQHGFLSNDILSKLNKLKLLSMDNTLVSADELYFSDPYLPRLSLSHFHLDNSKFLSETYLNEIQGTKNLLKQFFLSFGVQEDIKWIQFNEEQHNELIAAYRFRQTENRFQYGLLRFQHCRTFPFLEVTRINYEFALLFWHHIIHSINVHEMNENELLGSDQQHVFRVDNLPYWFVRSHTCIPTTTRQLLKSTDVFSSNLRSIAGDFLPVFACQTIVPLPAGWQHFFQFKTQFSIQDHIQLLNSIYDRSKQSPLNDDTETCIQRIYTSLINCLSNMDRRNLDQYRPKAPFYLLSTLNNKFRLCTNLVVSITKDFHLPNEIPQLKLSTGNSCDAHLTYLLDFFHIKSIGINDLALPANIIAKQSLSLRAKLRDIQASLYDLAQAHNITKHRIDYDLEVYEVDRLELYYNETIPVLQKDIHIADNRIYIIKPWTSERVISKLSQILCQEFKLPMNIELNIRQLLLHNEQNTPSTMLLSFDPAIDLFRMEETRKKFATIIDRDNEQLFSQLKITDEIIPAELLTLALDAQSSPHCGFVYHYTHLENAVSILREKCFKCQNNLLSNEFKDSTDTHIIQSTHSEVKDYVRFYFRPLTLAQYCDENLGLSNLTQRYGNQSMCPVPVIFRIDLEALLAIDNVEWKISLGNMDNHQTEFDNTIDIVRRFDFQGVYADIRTERGRYSSQQEFLIKSQLNLDQLQLGAMTLIFQDQNAFDSLECMISHNYRSIIDTAYYYGINPRVMIHFTDTDNEVSICIENLISSERNEQLILQLSGDDTHRTVQGNLKASFQRGTISTFYSPQQLSFIANLEHVKYAIYYEYETRKWLIHTNSSTSRFISPT